MSAVSLAPLPAPAPAWPGLVLALAFAFFAGCPVLANLVSTYVADGHSFAVTAAIACAVLAAALLAAARLGPPAHPLASLRGPTLPFAVVAAVFWSYWILVNLLSPSPQPMMHWQVAQAGVWLLGPLAIFALWRRWIEPRWVIRMLVVLYIVFIVGLTLRWALGLGLYQSGRWHAGKSLEAIRTGRYAVMALWVLGLAALCPPMVVPPRLKLAALACLPLAVLMLVAANARGPWLALVATIIVTSVPLARLLARRIGRDARVLAVLLLAVAAVAAFVASQIGSVESKFDRLFTLTKDGGSAEGRVTLLHDHLQLLSDTPLVAVAGTGYGHGYFYPHNVPVEALVDGGILAFALLLAMYALTFHAWLRRCPGDDVPCLLIAGMFILSLVGSQVSGSIATDLTWFFPLLLAIAIAARSPATAIAGSEPAGVRIGFGPPMTQHP